MRRCEFIAGLGGTAWPIRAFGSYGQQKTSGGSYSERHLVHALVLLVAFGIVAATPTKAAQSIPYLSPFGLPFRGTFETPALFEASAAGDLSRVQALLAAKADVNAKAANGATSLIAASQNGHLEVVQALLAAKADVNAKTADGGTALMLASQNGHLEGGAGLAHREG
jgi:ankyrin repeat protein